MDGVSNSHVYTDIIMFTYNRHVKCNIQIQNVSKAPKTILDLSSFKKIKKISLYHFGHHTICHKPTKKISQTSLKHYNQFRIIRNEALRWLKIITDKLKNT